METSNIPYFARQNVKPPQASQKHAPLSHKQSLSALRNALNQNQITPGQHTFLTALLTIGSVKQFPGGLGLNYDQVFKLLYYPGYTWPIINEMAKTLLCKVDQIDAILMPERSAVIPGAQFSIALADNIPVIRMEKNNVKTLSQRFAFQVDSYTAGGKDIISVRKDVMAALLANISRSGGANLLLVDEILDTGAMAKGVGEAGGFIHQCRQAGLQVNLAAVATLMAKTYTKAKTQLKQALKIPIISGIDIEDLWLSSNYGPGIKVEGVKYGLSFKQ
ncbi:MAG: hypothetical protein GXP43_00940 [bacterium]|nr:hypothetical protein [bacterium]